MSITQEIIDFWFGKFHAIGEEVIPFFVNCSLPKSIFLSKYESLPPIETMPEKEKKEMKKYVISMFPDKTPEQKIEACKIIYTIGTLL
jgi:hypothetical protein